MRNFVLFIKKQIEWKMSIDYYTLNTLTKNNDYPLLRI